MPGLTALSAMSGLSGIMGGAYIDKVLSYGPIAYWPLYEASGTTAACLINAAQNGTYSSDVSGWPPGTGIGDGNTAPYFDGANDYVNVDTAALDAAYNGAEFTIAGWVRVNNAATWTDGAARRIWHFRIDANNYIYAYKQSGTNGIACEYRAGGVLEFFASGALSSTDWIHVAMTVSKTADAAIQYINGSNTSSAGTLGNWAGGALTIGVLGANDLVPVQVWHGWECQVAMWTSALAPAVIADLATV